ncbi:hypothetical protein FRC20_009110 [Serendipita sp. 405]|nr:hypothetical protein FRC20_009110 [Serendipita sp. 405]
MSGQIEHSFFLSSPPSRLSSTSTITAVQKKTAFALMWSIVRSLTLILTQFITLGILVLSVHLSVARWSLSGSGFSAESFTNITAGDYDMNTETFSVAGTYISTGAVGAALTFSITTVLILSVMIISGIRKATTCMSLVCAELSWTFIMSSIWLATIVGTMANTAFPLSMPCRGLGICMEIQALEVLLILVWLFLVLYFLVLISLAFVGVSRGCDDTFTTPAFSNFFLRHRARRANDDRQSRTEVTSVYSTSTVQPIHIELRMSNSASRDIISMGGDQEIKHVSFSTPHTRPYHKPFILADNEDGDVSDIVLDEDINEEKGADAKARPLA